MANKRLKISILLSVFFVLGALCAQAEVSVDAGKQLFKANCAQCHNRNMKDNMTGPALGGVQDRWAGREELLHAWVRNSQAVIASGDPYTNDLFNTWNKVLMNPFPNLTDDEINSILAYIDAVYTGKDGGAQAAAAPAAVAEAPKTNYTLVYGVLVAILALLALILARIVGNLDHIQKFADGETDQPRPTFRQVLTSKGVIAFVIFAVIVLGGYTTVNNAISFGRQQHYQPDQPIKFSHVTHAGVHKIDCQYCHDGARRSKQSVIPAANTCMNCHKAIKKGSTYGTAELTKIFASVGFDPSTDTYIQNYDQMSTDEIEAIYKKWISENYVADHELASLDSKGEKAVKDQWNGIVSALTGENDPKIAGPIEWKRIHNLPDHVYFNHSQHVTVGKLECQQCHGKVEEMAVVQQYATLSMGWCINCHRQTEVQFGSNPYYESYEKYHRELTAGKREKVTVADIGGTECQKCHY